MKRLRPQNGEEVLFFFKYHIASHKINKNHSPRNQQTQELLNRVKDKGKQLWNENLLNLSFE